MRDAILLNIMHYSYKNKWTSIDILRIVKKENHTQVRDLINKLRILLKYTAKGPRNSVLEARTTVRVEKLLCAFFNRDNADLQMTVAFGSEEDHYKKH